MSGTVSYTASSITSTWVPDPSDVSVVGYYSSGTAVATIVCGTGYEFLVSSTYGICCPVTSSGDCGYHQTCLRSMMVYEDGSSYTCENNNPCVSTTMYQREPSNGWSATMAWCMDADNPTTLYRSFVGTQLTLVPVDEDFSTNTLDDDTTTTSPTTTTTTTPTFTTTTTSLSDGVQTPTPDNGDDGPNVGAIAGGVVGGVAGLALILFAIWFVLRQQRKKNAELREIGNGYVAPEPK
ncbi:hypothetical protein BJY01DRAFT_253996 [Aspergillus pseudoustus]|uniref:Mid2 domain-containing protein n=1 Tax=Aspergillus pseudoustus TaxID=1810923 RepID=A0ABR4IWS1_9EURO